MHCNYKYQRREKKTRKKFKNNFFLQTEVNYLQSEKKSAVFIYESKVDSPSSAYYVCTVYECNSVVIVDQRHATTRHRTFYSNEPIQACSAVSCHK